MSARSPGRRAALPQPGFRRPDTLSAAGLVVSVTGEDGGHNGTYDFTDAAGAPQLKRELVAAFARLASSAGTWTTAGTCRVHARSLRRFLRFVEDNAPQVASTLDLTAGLWNQWRLSVGHGQFSSAGLIRRLLCEVLLTDATLAAVAARARKPRQLPVESYSSQQFRIIRDAARRTVSQAAARIGEGARLVADWRAGLSPPDTDEFRWGQLLHQISLTGEFPTATHDVGPSTVSATAPGLVSVPGKALRRLYPSYVEIGAAAVLLICHEAWNASTLTQMQVPDQYPNADPGTDEPAVHRTATVKSRRPRDRRHGSNNLVDAGPTSSGRAMRDVLAITAPARATLTLLGEPTSALLIARRTAHAERWSRFAHGDSLWLENAIGRWSRQVRLTDATGVAVHVSARRLRRSVQVHYGGPRNNSTSTHENVYLLRDELLREQSADVVAQGLSDAVDHAAARVRMRLFRTSGPAEHDDTDAFAARAGIGADTARQVATGALDTAVAACVDFEHSPFTPSGPCAVSFLMCFACPNALATDLHLPRIVYLHEAMTTLRSALAPAAWATDWAGHYSRVAALLDGHTTEAERLALRARINDRDRHLVDALLTRRLDG